MCIVRAAEDNETDPGYDIDAESNITTGSRTIPHDQSQSSLSEPVTVIITDTVSNIVEEDSVETLTANSMAEYPSQLPHDARTPHVVVT